jgi:hypothetical protein
MAVRPVDDQAPAPALSAAVAGYAVICRCHPCSQLPNLRAARCDRTPGDHLASREMGHRLAHLTRTRDERLPMAPRDTLGY